MFASARAMTSLRPSLVYLHPTSIFFLLWKNFGSNEVLPQIIVSCHVSLERFMGGVRYRSRASND
jgi:hypothetical protein